jgi:hypothetical protein
VTTPLKLFSSDKTFQGAVSLSSRGAAPYFLLEHFGGGDMFYKTALCPETQIEDRTLLLRTNQNVLHAATGIPQQRISDAFAGKTALSVEHAAQLMDVTRRLLDIRKAMYPFPLDLSKAGPVKEMLDGLDGVSIDGIREAIQNLFATKQ